MKEKLIVIIGPTAVGKTQLSIDLAQTLYTEIISGDSMLVYKGLDIGSAKPGVEEQKGIQHHIIDILDPWENFNVTDFLALVKPLISDLNAEGKIPILAGGTGLYVKSLLEGYQFNSVSADPEYRVYLESLAAIKGREYVYNMLKSVDPKAAERLHINNFKRVIRALEVYHLGEENISQSSEYAVTGELVYDAMVIGLNRNRALLYERINERVDLMLEMGLESEVKALLEQGANPSWQSMKGIGYQEMVSYLQGNIDFDTAVEQIKKSTRHFAKRQLTWFRKMPYISWYNLDDYADCDNGYLSELVEKDINKFYNINI